jgi:hypothetical protein
MTGGLAERRTTQLKRAAALIFLASGGWNFYLGIVATPAGEIDSLRCWAGAVCVLAAALIERTRRRPQRR